MKNHKAMTVISWIMSVVFILSAGLISIGGMSKNVIVNLGLAAGWLIIHDNRSLAKRGFYCWDYQLEKRVEKREIDRSLKCFSNRLVKVI